MLLDGTLGSQILPIGVIATLADSFTVTPSISLDKFTDIISSASSSADCCAAMSSISSWYPVPASGISISKNVSICSISSSGLGTIAPSSPDDSYWSIEADTTLGIKIINKSIY